MELLQQVRLIDPTQGVDRLSDILIAEGKIKAIANKITEYPPQTQVSSGKGLIIGTGLVDLYSHAQEPGNESRESLFNLSQAAIAGGFIQVGILPDTTPRIDNVEVLAAIKQKSSFLHQFSPLCFWGEASKDNANKQMNELAQLKLEAVGFSDHYSLGSLNLLKQLLEYVQPWQKTIAIALDRNELAGDGIVREGEASIRYGVSGNPGFSEAAIIAAVLEIVADIPTPVHIMRVSTKRGVELIANAKQRNIPITASTTWMHLLWNSESVSSYDPNLRLEPPLGDKDDQKALLAGIKQGIIDAIATDHQAYTYEEKTVPFALAPSGVIGLEIALPLLWQELVETKQLSALELWQALSTNPRMCLQQKPFEISVEQDSNFILFDPKKTWIANQENLKSPAANTPYYNKEIIGKVISHQSSVISHQ
ncbi:MAG: dihydroorotase [Pleurocapsa sp.]